MIKCGLVYSFEKGKKEETFSQTQKKKTLRKCQDTS